MVFFGGSLCRTSLKFIPHDRVWEFGAADDKNRNVGEILFLGKDEKNVDVYGGEENAEE